MIIRRNSRVILPELMLYDCGLFRLRVVPSALEGRPAQPPLEPGCRCRWTWANDRWALIISPRCPVHTDTAEK
jgi:hypothetical protein